ncbi:MAG: aspartate aminotransferase family protein [Acidimicrobiales bacterium]|nr:aspartate aminotransferase family protein [Acidimicrobiales bacterium]
MALSPFLHPFAPPAKDEADFVTIVGGEGAEVWDDRGNRYVDAMASLWYCNVGHGRAEIADAVAEQMRTLAAYHCFDPFTNEPAERLSADIAARAPMDDARVFLVSSGSEAVDSALKLARLAQGLLGRPQERIVGSREFAYHGVTYGGMSAQGLPANQAGYGDLVPGHVTVPNNDIEALASVFAQQGDQIAAVIAEPVQGAGGVFPPAPGYLEGLRRLCDQHDAFLIADEVITGFGRLGQWFGSAHFGIRPDLVTFAKGVTSGYLPLGGVVVGPAVRAPLEADPSFLLRHGHTYSGHPAVCVAADKSMEITEREELLPAAERIGLRLSSGLRALEADGLVQDVRGEGGVWAVSLGEGRDVAAVRDAMRVDGVIVRAVPPNHLTFCPPLVVTDAQLDRCVDVLERAVR